MSNKEIEQLSVRMAPGTKARIASLALDGESQGDTIARALSALELQLTEPPGTWIANPMADIDALGAEVDDVADDIGALLEELTAKYVGRYRYEHQR